MTPLYSLTGFVLKRRHHREADRVYTFFSRELGKVDLLSRGGRRLHAKLSPHLESPSLVRAFVADGRRGFTLAGADVEELFHARGAWATERAVLFTSASHLIDLATKWHGREPALFEHMLAWMRFTHQSEPVTPLRTQLLFGGFALKLIHACGYAPELYACLYCRRAVTPETFAWSSARGGVVCRGCLKEDTNSWFKVRAIGAGTLKLLRFAQEHSWEELCRVEIVPDVLREFHLVVDSLILSHFPLIPSMSVPAMTQVDHLEAFSVE